MIEHVNLDERNGDYIITHQKYALEYYRRLKLFMGRFHYAPYSEFCPKEQFVDFLMYYFANAYSISIDELIPFRDVFVDAVNDYYNSTQNSPYYCSGDYENLPWDEFKTYVDSKISSFIENLEYSRRLYNFPFEKGHDYCNILPYFATIVVYYYKKVILSNSKVASEGVDLEALVRFIEIQYTVNFSSPTVFSHNYKQILPDFIRKVVAIIDNHFGRHTVLIENSSGLNHPDNLQN